MNKEKEKDRRTKKEEEKWRSEDEKHWEKSVKEEEKQNRKEKNKRILSLTIIVWRRRLSLLIKFLLRWRFTLF